MTNARRLIVAIVSAFALVAFGLPSTAGATPNAPDVTATVAEQQARAITASLEAQGVQPVATRVGNTQRVTYTLPSGSTVVVVQPVAQPGAITPLFSVGVGWGVYIYLSRSDQIVVTTGGATGLGILICGATVLVTCAVVGTALAGAAAWIAERGGICPTSAPRLEIHIRGYTTYKCVR